MALRCLRPQVDREVRISRSLESYAHIVKLRDAFRDSRYIYLVQVGRATRRYSIISCGAVRRLGEIVLAGNV